MRTNKEAVVAAWKLLASARKGARDWLQAEASTECTTIEDEDACSPAKSTIDSAWSASPSSTCESDDADSGVVKDVESEGSCGTDIEDNIREEDEENDEGVEVEDSGETEQQCHHCRIPQCFCRHLRAWLQGQADKNADILESDAFFVNNTSTFWPARPLRPSEVGADRLFDPYPNITTETYRYAGTRDRLGRPHDRGTAYFPNGRKFVGCFSHGERSGHGELFERDGSKIVSGTYVRDRLHGVCQVAANDGGLLVAAFFRGVASGPARRYHPDGFLQWTGRYLLGTPTGLCWRSNDGEGWLSGPGNKYCRITTTGGDQAVYLYPDLHTALVGTWSNDSMQAARLCRVSGLRMENGMPVPLVEDVKAQPVYSVDVSTIERISRTPLLPDPYESAQVRSHESSVAGGGDGLYARKSIPKGTVVAFYNGTRFHDCHAFNDWQHNSYKIRLNEKKKQILDIPLQSRLLSNYCASLAHKVNHSFFPNARFSDFAHPRFGRILCVKTLRAVQPGEELFCNYGYSPADCPNWYKDLHEALFFDQRETLTHKL